jgi:hypothetical protein
VREENTLFFDFVKGRIGQNSMDKIRVFWLMDENLINISAEVRKKRHMHLK